MDQTGIFCTIKEYQIVWNEKIKEDCDITLIGLKRLIFKECLDHRRIK